MAESKRLQLAAEREQGRNDRIGATAVSNTDHKNKKAE